MEITPIGYISTPYKEKFAIPRQPGLVKAAKGIIQLDPEFADINAFRGIEQFSHLWLIFQFNHVPTGKWSPLVRPPRLGGNEKLGVFATRSTHRPSNMGLSVVQFEKVENKNGKVLVHVAGVDLMDGTPILDIKPYIAYVDAIPEAKSGFAGEAPAAISVVFSITAQQALEQYKKQSPDLEQLIKETLALNPAPAYHNDQNKNADRIYGVRIYELNVTWKIKENQIEVSNIEKRL